MTSRIVAALTLFVLLGVGLLSLAQTGTATPPGEPAISSAFALGGHANGLGATAFTGSITVFGQPDLAVWGGDVPPFGPLGTSQRNYVISGTGDATDPRVSGLAEQTFGGEYVVADDGFVSSGRGPLTITNDQGQWEGTFASTGSWSAAAPDEQLVIGEAMLLGRGGYEGLLLTMHFECMGDRAHRYDCTRAGWIEPVFTAAEIDVDWAERPVRIDGRSWVTDVWLAGEPFVDTSTFDGRCSAPAYWVFHGAFEGVSSQFGPITGTNSHCFLEYRLSDGIITITLPDGSTISETYAGDAIVREDWSGWWRGRTMVAGATGRLSGANGATIDRHIYVDVTTYMPDFGPGDETAQFASEGRIGVRPSLLMAQP